MKLKKKYLPARILIALLAVLLLAGGAVPVYAAAYQTYTYSINGDVLLSPDAYTPERTIHSADLDIEGELNTPKDIVVDSNNNVYIADTGNNRILAFTEYFNFRFEISKFVNGEGVDDSFSNPSGCFVTDDSIYVADTDNKRIVVFDLKGNFKRIFEEPRADVMPDDSVYRPIALAVDSANRIYVVSSTTYMGVIVLDSDGEFQNFIGAQMASYNLLDLFWQRFQNEEQRNSNNSIVSTEYNNISIDEDNFLYVTSSAIDEEKQMASVQNNDRTYSPVKKLNAQGTDIMTRNGFFGPGGEVATASETSAAKSGISGASTIVDVACGPEGTWSVIDQKRSKVYTYDDQGNLLFAFGDSGQMLGNIQTLNGITYQGDRLLLLDRMDNSITVYNRTEYGDILINALHNNNVRDYSAAVDDWKAILQRNANFDVAYVGLGKASYNNGEFENAMNYFKAAYDTDNYDTAFRQLRNRWVSQYFMVIPIVVVAFLFALTKIFGWAGKVNKNTSLARDRKRSFKEEVCYAYHVMLHPFDGFWDLKHEKRGSVASATFWLAMVILAFIYQSFGTGYIVKGATTTSVAGGAFAQAMGILLPLLLFVTANWCLTTLFDGEGSFKDVYIATCYAAAPLSFLIFLSTIVSNFVSSSETGFVSLISGVAWVWFALLLFFGIMVVHDYSISKNILTFLGTVVGMCLIMFIVILFSGLLMKMTGFISNISTELSFRI